MLLVSIESTAEYSTEQAIAFLCLVYYNDRNFFMEKRLYSSVYVYIFLVQS